MLFAELFRRQDPAEDAALLLYATLVDKARDPVFYSRLAVPDTVNGRFDMLVIHAMLVLRRLRGAGEAADAFGKALLELLFRDMDQSLREMGVGDMGIARHIKKMAKALFGRAEAYEAGLAGNVTLLIEALKENVYRRAEGEQHLSQMADYLARAASHVGTQDVGDIVAGKINLSVPALSEVAHAG